VTRVVSASANWTSATSSLIPAISASASTFVLETISEGEIMNSNGPTGSNNTLISGSSDNIRWEIASSNTSSGVFSLLIRREKREKRFSKLQERFAKKQVRWNILKDKKDKASIIYKSKLEKQLAK